METIVKTHLKRVGVGLVVVCSLLLIGITARWLANLLILWLAGVHAELIVVLGFALFVVYFVGAVLVE